jgi:hypothetical protein
MQMLPNPPMQNSIPSSMYPNTSMHHLPQPHLATAPIMTPIPLSIPNQHMMQTQVPILGGNLRAQVISAVAPQTHIMPAVNCVTSVRHPITSSVVPAAQNMAPGGVIPPVLAKQPALSPVGNGAAALVGPSVKPSVKTKSQVLSASKIIRSSFTLCEVKSQILFSLKRVLQGNGNLDDLATFS